MSGLSTTSTATLKTDVTSKVLPGDKTGLPLEIWQIIFSYLSVRDLCCVARVSKTWYDLSLSIDMTRWKELYLACKEWRHPFWPLNLHLEPLSWKLAYRNQHLSTRFWNHGSRQVHKTGCMTLLKRSRERQTIEVGPGLPHQTLKSAFTVASEYDRILVHPGIYDEQLEMSQKAPYELVGVGELGSVILVVCLEHLASTGRLSNLVLRAPWFTNFILKVRSGYVQVDNCIIEDGMMCVVNPASCHVQFCTFRHSTIILQHVNSSIIRNCEFSQSDNANIVVEGYPKDEKCWAYTHLCQQTDAVFTGSPAQVPNSLLRFTDSTTSTLRSILTGKSLTASTLKTADTLSRGRAFSQEGDACAINAGAANPGASSGGGHGAGTSNPSSQHPVMREASKGKETCGVNNGDQGGGGNASNINRTGGKVDSVRAGKEGQSASTAASNSSDANQHSQHRSRENTDVSQNVGQEPGENHKGSSEPSGQADEADESQEADDGEWLEINDERKPWQLAGEERWNKTCGYAHCMPAESSHPDSTSADRSSPGSAQAQGASEKLFERRDIPQLGASNRLGEGEGGDKSTSHAKGDRIDGRFATGSDVKRLLALDSDKTVHATDLELNCAASKVTSPTAGTFTTVETGNDVKGEHLPQNGDLCAGEEVGGAAGGGAAPHKRGDHSRYHYHNPPILHNPHPHLRPHSDPPLIASQNQENLRQSQSRSAQSQLMGNHPSAGEHAPAAAEVEERRSEGSFHSRHRNDSSGSSDEDDDLSILNDLESVGSHNGGSHRGNSSSSSSDDPSEVEELFQADSEYDCSDAEESVIMLPHLRQKHLEASLSANAVNADVGSICSQASQPITLSASQDEGVLSHIHKVRGCLIHQCRMMHSKGGVMVSLQGHALISGCDISNVSYGIRCIQNARVVVLKNRIHHCRTSGIFMRLAATGLIAGNDIHSNNEAGLDIRKNADPTVQHNRIHHGKRSGIVVLGSGRGQIHSNSIYSNTEAGIYILYGGNPTVSENHIYDGKAAGVAINEGGQGFIFDNTISSNQWGGVDIRRGSCPMVCRNSITSGLGDGIVIGDQGQGTIENNIISDNAGCGLWLMSASRPYIHGNQISNNGDTGVMMVNKTDIQHEGSHMLPAGADSVDHISRTLSMMGGLMDDMPTPRPKCAYTTLQHNNIYHNAGRGVAVELGSKVDILYNAIYANLHDGVWVHQESPLTLGGNNISSNRGHGVVTNLASSMEISGNGIYDNRDCGIVCSGHVNITENDVIGNQAGGITVEENGVAKIVGNRIYAANKPTVKVAEQAGESIVEGNKLFHSASGQELLDLSVRVVARDNDIVQLPGDKGNQQPRHKSHKEATAFNKSQFLTDPPPRPAIQPPPPPSDLPAHNVSTITKVMVPADDSCQQGSKLCILL